MEITRIEQKTLGRIAIIKVVWHDQVTAYEQQLPRLAGLRRLISTGAPRNHVDDTAL
jgi:hypothetical protein